MLCLDPEAFHTPMVSDSKTKHGIFYWIGPLNIDLSVKDLDNAFGFFKVMISRFYAFPCFLSSHNFKQSLCIVKTGYVLIVDNPWEGAFVILLLPHHRALAAQDKKKN